MWLGLAGCVLAAVAASASVGIALNGVALTAPPGAQARLIHYLFRNSAATSASGSGRADCASLAPSPRRRRSGSDLPARVVPDDRYPELVQRGFPGISQAELYGLARQAVQTLGGWQVVGAEPETHILQCTYTSRIFHFVDDVKIVIMPDNEIGLCSQSRRWLGDLGANIGHIQDFYAALTPLLEQAYAQHAQQARHFPGNGWR
jgi:hypothetical protein